MTATRRLKKSSTNKMLAGVCGGIAEYFDVDPTLVRVAYVLLSLVSMVFAALLVYVILAFVMPE